MPAPSYYDPNVDFERYVRNNNPYTSIASNQYSPDAQVAPTFGALQAGGFWDQSQRNARAQQLGSVNNASFYNPAANPNNSAWGGFRGAPAVAGYQNSANAAGSAGPNPYYTIANTKNPQIASLLDRILGQAGAGYDMNSNPYTLYKNTKDTAQGGRINEAGAGYDASTGSNRQTLADFTKNYLGGQPQINQYTQQEANSVGQWYGNGPGSVQGNLDTLAKQRELAVARAMDRALGRARGTLNSNRLQYGDSSNLNSQYLNSVADVMAEEARQQADLGRTNYLATRAGQDANLGRRQQLYDASQSRMLLPIQAQTQLTSAELAQLGQLGGLNDQNSIYNVDTPESVLARRLGILGQAGQIDSTYARTYGLGKASEPDFSGYAYQPPRRPLGNYPVNPPYYPPDPYYPQDPYSNPPPLMPRGYDPRSGLDDQSYV